MYPIAGQPLVSQPQYLFAVERAGVYTVVVQTTGYQDWSRSGVRVDSGVCEHVETVDLTATLAASVP
jgi:hypothetical protein